MKIRFSPRGWEDYEHWRNINPRIFERITGLITVISQTPFVGAGKPEPLKGELKGWWSRRITIEHRLVYRVSGKGDDQAVEIASCRFHY